MVFNGDRSAQLHKTVTFGKRKIEGYTENRYAGVLSTSSLLKIINEKQLKTARDQNPLTSLPGTRSIRDYVQDAIRDRSGTRFFCYCDFDNFKPFNDRYGF